MSQRVKKVPKELKITVGEFITKYLGLPPYKGKDNLTHGCMKDYLLQNQYPLPTRLSFDSICEEDLLVASVLYVVDSKNHAIPYRNPLYQSAKNLFHNLERVSKEELEARRKEILKEEKQRRMLALIEEKRTRLETLQIAKEQRESKRIKAELENYRNQLYLSMCVNCTDKVFGKRRKNIC